MDALFFTVPLTLLMFIGWYYTGKSLDKHDEELEELKEKLKASIAETALARAKLGASNKIFAEVINNLCNRLIRDEQAIINSFDIVDANHIHINDILNKHAFFIERYHCSFLEYYFNNLHLKKTIAAPGYELYTEVASPEQEFALQRKIMKLDEDAVKNGWVISLANDSSSNTDHS